MFHLTPEFMRHAAALSTEQTTKNDSATDADAGGALTLEMRDNPFASLMRQIERLIDLDPKEAFRMAQIALLDKIFDGDLEEKLRLKLDQLIDLVHKQEEKPDISGPFAKSALNLTTAQTVFQSPNLMPAPAFTR